MARTLWDALKEVPDQRGRKGRQIPLPSILALSVAAMLAGADSLIAIFRWGRRLRPEALQALGFDDGVAPCHATYHYVFLSLDADALSRVLGAFALGDAKAGHIAIDGKTLKGSRRYDAKPLHILSASAHEPSRACATSCCRCSKRPAHPFLPPVKPTPAIEPPPSKPSRGPFFE